MFKLTYSSAWTTVQAPLGLVRVSGLAAMAAVQVSERAWTTEDAADSASGSVPAQAPTVCWA